MLRDRLNELGIVLPAMSGPFGAYVPVRRAGNLLFVSGQLPMKAGELVARGAVPSQCSIDQARLAARQCAINALSAVATLGADALESLTGVIRIGAFVQSDPGFTQQPQVVNAASELLIELLGDSARHARAAVGVNALPLDASVEIEFLLEMQ